LLQARRKVKLFSYQFFGAMTSGNTKSILSFLVQGLFRGVNKFDRLIFMGCRSATRAPMVHKYGFRFAFLN